MSAQLGTPPARVRTSQKQGRPSLFSRTACPESESGSHRLDSGRWCAPPESPKGRLSTRYPEKGEESASQPVHGLIVLADQPGTGKTTLARGLASQVATALKGGSASFLQIDLHALTSSSLGRSQKEVAKLFQQTIPENAASGPCMVLLDEVETLAPDRKRMSFEANPVDVHRATDAALAGLDLLARNHRNVAAGLSLSGSSCGEGATSHCPAMSSTIPALLEYLTKLPLLRKRGTENGGSTAVQYTRTCL